MRPATVVPIRPSAATTHPRARCSCSTATRRRTCGWRQYRALGATALDLCSVADGRVDGTIDWADSALGPWDYLGAMLVLSEAGGHLADAQGRELVVLDHAARRTPVAAGTAELFDALLAARSGASMSADERPRGSGWAAPPGAARSSGRCHAGCAGCWCGSARPSTPSGPSASCARDDGAILLVRHSYYRLWGTPGGLAKRHERPEVAAVRETLEEVGLRVELVGEPVVVVEPVPHRVDIVYLARPATGVGPVDARVRPRPRSSGPSGSRSISCRRSRSRR